MSTAITNRKQRFVLHISVLLFSIAYIVSSVLDIRELRPLKAIPLILIIALVFPKHMNGTITKLLIALVLGIIGDMSLEYADGNFLVFGIGAFAFLFSHVFYNLTFFDIWSTIDNIYLLKRKAIMFGGYAFFFSVIGINLTTTISDELKDEIFPVVFILPIYSVFLTLDSIQSYMLLLANQKPSK